MTHRHVLLIVFAALAGCSDAPRIAALDANGIYDITARHSADDAGILIAQSEALAEARAFCRNHNRRLQSLRDNPAYEASTNQARFSLAFRCVDQAGAVSRLPNSARPATPNL